MDVSEFQRKLEEICSFAEKNDKKLTAAQVREYFQAADLDREQLLKILQYLKVKGISIEGAEKEKEQEQPESAEKKKVPLTPEEETYLKEYRESLGGETFTAGEIEELFERLAAGDREAKAILARSYLRVAAEMAAEKNCGEIFLADLIQEANLALLSALERPEPAKKSDAWLRAQIGDGIRMAIYEQSEQKLHDDTLVAKVENLEAAIRELTEDDEDEGSKFTLDELSILLDMDVEEMRDVLRLTGDDK